MTLVLRGVVLTSGHLEVILSSCSNLKKLTIDISELPSKLQLTGTVIDVVILECVGVKEIDLHAACLRTLVCKIKNDVTFFFSFVPMLENVMVSRCFQLFKYSYIFGDHARDLPNQVKSLTLQFFADQDRFVHMNLRMFQVIKNTTRDRNIALSCCGPSEVNLADLIVSSISFSFSFNSEDFVGVLLCSVWLYI
ncbi:hypothetical protein BC332_33690 [Capsicum chinense]|nr:hypothetical protein BC332_33690 [Capsicum chinense]